MNNQVLLIHLANPQSQVVVIIVFTHLSVHLYIHTQFSILHILWDCGSGQGDYWWYLSCNSMQDVNTLVVASWSGSVGSICSLTALGFSMNGDFQFPSWTQWGMIIGVTLVHLVIFLLDIFRYKVWINLT